MVSEDPVTYDIHADIVGGWPKLVSPVLKFARSLKYDPQNFPQEIYQLVGPNLKLIIQKLEMDSKRKTSYSLGVGGLLAKAEEAKASKILYGFKAPIAMTLVPWFAHFLPHFKFIHVIRF